MLQLRIQFLYISFPPSRAILFPYLGVAVLTFPYRGILYFQPVEERSARF